MPKLANHKEPWTSVDVRSMRGHARKCMSARQSAKVLGRTTGAVKFKAMVEGVRFHAIEQPRGVQRRRARQQRRAA